jgi:hypothetical protein
MKLDMQKIYIDSRFRTAGSKSETDFNVELPRSFNVPDGVVAHIDDIVIPVSWSTIDERNNIAYVNFYILNTQLMKVFTFDAKNYDGFTFATELQQKLTAAVVGFKHNGIPVVPVFSCVYEPLENILTISITENPDAAFTGFKMQFFPDEKLRTTYTQNEPNSINTIISNRTETFITASSPYTCYLDLFGTRNLYLTSSALCSYDTVSNFGMDTIIKKIPCTASYNKMIFQSSGSTLDGLDVSKRTLRFLDFKLVDSSFRTIPLRGNHFSFSIVFQQKR